MALRQGERLGWIGGWLGCFLWVLIVSVLVLAQGKTEQGSLGLGVVGLATMLVVLLAPWRHPTVVYQGDVLVDGDGVSWIIDVVDANRT